MQNMHTVYDGSVITATRARQLGLKKFVGNPCPKGHCLRRASNGGCAICSAQAAANFYASNKEHCLAQARSKKANPERKKKYAELWNARNPNYFQEHYQKNKDRITERFRKFAEENPETVKMWKKKDRQNNKDNYRKLIKAYKARKIKACPAWVDHSKIKEICGTLPDGWHVDHIVPLRGKNVCGLHVHWNMQHLPASENCRKRNTLPLDSMLIDYTAPGYKNGPP